MINKRILYIVNVDWFFLSHRLPLALAMKEDGYDVYILTKDTGKRTEIEGYGLSFINIDFERSGKNPFDELFVLIRILKCIYKYKPSLVHNVTIKPSIYASIVSKLTRRSEINIINAITGLGYNFIGDKKGFVQQILKSLMSIAFKRKVNFIFQNPDDLDLYQQLGYLKHNKFKLIKGAGVEHTEFSYHLPKPKKRLQVVLTARMLKDKGILEFIDAANILESRWKSNATFKLIGDIDIENPSGITIEELQNHLVGEYIVWEGFCSDVKPILANADIVCLPSYREGLPKSLIEAMAIGRPIVTTDVPGCRECVEQNYNGLLVPPKDSRRLANALETLLLDADLRLRMGENSREKMVKELSLNKVIADTLAFYQEVLK